jgi:hypothetical protein
VEIVTADVADAGAMRAAAAGMDAIVHLAANPVDAPFDVILQPNIVGTQRVFEAALATGVPRSSTRRATMSWLGWEPQDDAEAFASEVEEEPAGITRELDGGPYVGRLQHPKYD